ncbi:hypothetical protein LX32DRAFT_384385 [Colletotrichum zoysiae]|uniref:Uncharacterized protein n=1 Tax=Colletotrichum zoysiae TaxID=1216348 RepID=A0AAD9HH73_9PEZI|nr:hypothetical protein LX32DRAFT_384385 [Colletotrichum zoysiae]
MSRQARDRLSYVWSTMVAFGSIVARWCLARSFRGWRVLRPCETWPAKGAADGTGYYYYEGLSRAET